MSKSAVKISSQHFSRRESMAIVCIAFYKKCDTQINTPRQKKFLGRILRLNISLDQLCYIYEVFLKLTKTLFYQWLYLVRRQCRLGLAFMTHGRYVLFPLTNVGTNQVIPRQQVYINIFQDISYVHTTSITKHKKQRHQNNKKRFLSAFTNTDRNEYIFRQIQKGK